MMMKTKVTKGNKKMSTQQPQASSNTIEKEYKYFDLDTFTLKTEKATGTFVPATSLGDAMARIGNDEAKVVEAINDLLKSQVLAEMRKSVVSKGASKKNILLLAKPFRELAPYNQIKDRAEQTTAIFNFFKSVPSIIESIRNTPDTGDDDGNEE